MSIEHKIEQLKARIEKLEKPTKDAWDKIGAISTILGTVAIPLALVIVGYYIQASLSNLAHQRQRSEKLMEVATAVLAANPESNAARPELRNWAIDVVNHYSEVRLSEKAVQALQQVPLVPDVDTESRVELFNRELNVKGEERALFRGARIMKYSESFDQQEQRLRKFTGDKNSAIYLRMLFDAALFAEFSHQLENARKYYEACLSHPLAGDPDAKTRIGRQVGKEARRHLTGLEAFLKSGKSPDKFTPTIP
jgi:hypothetical protein